ncbi:hypothetical protein [Ralstonia insidiosa]|uniref:hypothetical protein n=1 Tax=Ralstonia insidiosa TaxID=190721 RepID=UPI000CEF082E|nr:hypothetical protein [Ralstonia insidiosa]
MNKTFSEYATSTAFAIQLSKNQCNALLRLDEHKGDPADCHTLSVGTLKGLDARGFVSWARDASGRAYDFEGLTQAGRLVVGLLREAGLTVDNTNTLSVLRRIDREAA